MNVDIKKLFSNDQKYNAINLLECSLFETIVCAQLELQNMDETLKEQLIKESEMIDKLLKLYYKFSKYNFCPAHFNSNYQLEDSDAKLLKDANFVELYQVLFDKFNLLVNDFMEIIEYNPNRVSFNNKTSVFLIAYASELKEIWEQFNDEFMEQLMNKKMENNKVYREEFMKEKLKFVPVAGAKGAWAKGPLKL